VSCKKATAVRAALGRPELRRLWEAARYRLEAGNAAQTFLVHDLSDAEAAALAGILGTAVQRRGSQRISIARLERALRESRFGLGLRDVLELLAGPLVDRGAERAAAARARDDAWQRAAAHPALARHPVLASWLDESRRSGTLLRSARAMKISEAELLGRALDVLARLPAAGVSLPVLAAEVTGDAHALDPDRSLGSVVLRAGSQLVGLPGPPSCAAERRHLWAALGVLCDPLSAQALVWGLRPAGQGLVARHLCEYADAGEPRRLTLRELRRERLSVAAGAQVFVCENPAVVAAAAERAGSARSALVCSEGMPSSAVMELLGALAASGARIRVHADFDWGGLRIGNFLAAQLSSFEPWRFSRVDYERALAACRDAAPLAGDGVEAAWDSELGAALAARSKAVLEEHVLDLLLGDLA
jgi:uncharacterized protein (TIGR02679 family)